MKKQILIASPVYNAQCSNHYKHAELKAAAALAQAKISHGFCDHVTDSLVPRARDYIADVFMRNEQFSHLLFIDADISFEPDSIMTLIESSSADSADDEHGVIAGGYAKKEINWDLVVRLVKAGVPAEDLHKYCSPPVLNANLTVGEVYTAFREGEPLLMDEVGTGFMLIRRNVFEKIRDQLGTNDWTKPPVGTFTPLYHPNHQDSEHFNQSKTICGYFFCTINPANGHLLSEDYAFCHRARDVGEKVWLHPSPKLVHWGSMSYHYNLAPPEVVIAHEEKEPLQQESGAA